MLKQRLPLSQLMLAVVLVAVGVVALRNHSAIVASSIFISTVLLIMFAMVGAIANQDNDRLPWLGFAIFATGHLILWGISNFPYLPFPNLPTDILLNEFAWIVLEDRSSNATHGTGPFNLSVANVDRIRLGQVAHSLVAVLIGILGSIVARFFRTKKAKTNPNGRD